MRFPSVFLSLSGKDDTFVENVFKSLPNGLAYYYKESFQTGGKLLDLMEKGIGNSSIFALFVSRASLDSVWVKFEIELARVKSISKENYRIFVYIIDPTVSSRDLPLWMQSYWAGSVGFSPKDIARHLRITLLESDTYAPLGAAKALGRGALVDTAIRIYYDRTAREGSAPDIFVFAGLAGIGRRTFSRLLFRNIFAQLPQLSYGPTVIVPQYGELADWWRGLRNEIEVDANIDSYSKDWNAFILLEETVQIDEVAKSIKYFSDIGQSVRIHAGNSLMQEDGSLKPWAKSLFVRLHADGSILSIISNRQVREYDIRDLPYLLQVHTPPLDSGFMQPIVSATLELYGKAPTALPEGIIRAIGGHPSIARAAARLIAQEGPDLISKKPHILYGVQDDILSESISYDVLSDIQRSILNILSWVPHIRSDIIYNVLLEYNNAQEDDIVDGLQDLILSSLVDFSGDSYIISQPVRYLFRRKHGFGDEKLLSIFSEHIKAEWHRIESGDANFDSDLIDTVAFMYSLEGKSLPTSLRSILPPSVLLDLLREIYNRGRDDQSQYMRVCEWADAAINLKCDEATREEILAYIIRANIRTGRDKEALELLALFDNRGYRSRHFLRGFYLRLKGKFPEAIPHYREALKVRKYIRSCVHELAICLQREGKEKELQTLLEDYHYLVQDSAFLLDFMIGSVIASGRFQEAEAMVEKLRYIPDEDGRVARRTAQILMRRDKAYDRAVKELDRALEAGKGSAAITRAMRAIAASYANNIPKAKEDIEFVRKRMQNGSEVAKRLEAHFALAGHRYAEAHSLIDSVKDFTTFDRLLKARILETEASDVRTPLTRRAELIDEAESLRANLNFVADVDFGFLIN